MAKKKGKGRRGVLDACTAELLEERIAAREVAVARLRALIQRDRERLKALVRD